MQKSSRTLLILAGVAFSSTSIAEEKLDLGVALTNELNSKKTYIPNPVTLRCEVVRALKIFSLSKRPLRTRLTFSITIDLRTMTFSSPEMKPGGWIEAVNGTKVTLASKKGGKWMRILDLKTGRLVSKFEVDNAAVRESGLCRKI
jgi:hypothetical protein